MVDLESSVDTRSRQVVGPGSVAGLGARRRRNCWIGARNWAYGERASSTTVNAASRGWQLRCWIPGYIPITTRGLPRALTARTSLSRSPGHGPIALSHRSETRGTSSRGTRTEGHSPLLWGWTQRRCGGGRHLREEGWERAAGRHVFSSGRTTGESVAGTVPYTYCEGLAPTPWRRVMTQYNTTCCYPALERGWWVDREY